MLSHCVIALLLSALSPISSSYAASIELPSTEVRQQLREAINAAPSFGDRFDAEVWLVDMSSRLERYVKDPQERLAILRLVHHYATQANLSPQLVLAVIEVESHFNRFAISSVGAQGLMQIMPFWKNEIGTQQDNLTHIETNLKYGCSILSHYLKKEKGGLTQALARYNGSYNQTWYPEKVLLAWEKHWFVN
ncbi:MAG: hypothetical protein COB04_18935 [Gammaproteobacteria bacterium]|nr:MAG: hypothetical protein COB04_18935 [Gammaproteobacteria bacterium]